MHNSVGSAVHSLLLLSREKSRLIGQMIRAQRGQTLLRPKGTVPL